MESLSAEELSILRSVIALCLLSFFMLVVMYLTRIPAMEKMHIKPQAAAHPGSLNVLPSEVKRIADNYNHLFEQPTVFYALAIAIVLLRHADGLHVGCAWTYVTLRYLHSAIQSTCNIVVWRFSVFLLSWVALGIMILRESWALML